MENEIENVSKHPENEEERSKNIRTEAADGKKDKKETTHIFLFVCVIVVTLGILLETQNTQVYKDEKNETVSRYWVYSATTDVHNKNGVLKHVHLVLERIGYELGTNQTPWSLLWSHDYPFVARHPSIHKLQPHQKVNHYPGTSFITSKVDFATTDYKYIPKAFKLPKDKEEFLNYATMNKDAMFVEKSVKHRHVYLKNVSEIDLSNATRFVQEYVQRPFLVDGHKFDIGVYVVLVSVSPLRVYWYKGDVVFRYCPAQYYPFDPQVLNKYVIGDNYMPTWQVPSLRHSYSDLGAGQKDCFDTYVISKGKDPGKIWERVNDAITGLFLKKEHHSIDAVKRYKSQDNFFEMMRVDLILDEDMNVYLLEANMSPNLSSARFPPNQLLYEQVLYNLFSLTGVANHMKIMKGYNAADEKAQSAAENMVTSDKNLAVWGHECSTICRGNCEGLQICRLCQYCVDVELRHSLRKAHREFLHRGDFRRLYPPPMQQGAQVDYKSLESLSEANKLQHLWFQGKCNIDPTWCT